MNIRIEFLQPTDAPAWDAYVHAHSGVTLYHLSGWKNIIEKTYGHQTHYLMAYKQNPEPSTCSKQEGKPNDLNKPGNSTNPLVGILPLIHLKHFLFGNSLISIPFFDLGGVLADDQETEKALLDKAIALGKDLGVKNLELRQTEPLSWFPQGKTERPEQSCQSSRSCQKIAYATKSHKVRMLLDLPSSSELLMKSFKSKLRSQIRKPMKEGLTSELGGAEMLDAFYEVFLVNMRDLGSPVHSKCLIKNVLNEFSERAKICIVKKENKPLAASVIVGFKDVLENPWASAIRGYSKLNPNMLLYWTMLEYACDKGFQYFDFGRSTPGEGTYKFKEQWGAKPTNLHWQYVSLNGQTIDQETSEKSRFQKAIRYWQRMPVPITRIIGPMIRKHIGL